MYVDVLVVVTLITLGGGGEGGLQGLGLVRVSRVKLHIQSVKGLGRFYHITCFYVFMYSILNLN